MITIKFCHYTVDNKKTLLFAFKKAYESVSSNCEHKCQYGNNCGTSIVCKDLQRTIDFLEKEIRENR